MTDRYTWMSPVGYNHILPEPISTKYMCYQTLTHFSGQQHAVLTHHFTANGNALLN